jgi:hypothetical protein
MGYADHLFATPVANYQSASRATAYCCPARLRPTSIAARLGAA